MIFVSSHDLYETAAENLGMRLLQPTRAFVLVQADVLFHEAGWNLWLAAGLTPSVFAVSARCVLAVRGHGARGRPGDSHHPCLGDSRVPRSSLQLREQLTAVMWDVAPRGPLLLDVDATRALGYFDEGCFHLGYDDYELQHRAFARFGWRSAFVYVDVHQPRSLHQHVDHKELEVPRRPNQAWRRRMISARPSVVRNFTASTWAATDVPGCNGWSPEWSLGPRAVEYRIPEHALQGGGGC